MKKITLFDDLANMFASSPLNPLFADTVCNALHTTADSTTADSTTADSTTADSTTADSTTADSTTADSAEGVCVFNVRYCEPRPAEYFTLNSADRVFLCGVVDDLRYDARVMTKPCKPAEIDLVYIHVEGFKSAFLFADEFDAIEHFEISGDWDNGEAWLKYFGFTVVLKWGDPDED